MVNKQYRALLVAKSSARLWKDARERLKIPAVTSGDYQEWQYASLIFGTRCQVSSPLGCRNCADGAGPAALRRRQGRARPGRLAREVLQQLLDRQVRLRLSHLRCT